MTFNISYNIISLIMLSVVAFHFFRSKYYPVFSNRLYGFLLILGIANLALDTIGSVMVIPGLNTPVWLSYIVNTLYYLVLLVFPAAQVFYLLAMVQNKEKVEKKAYVLVLIPCILSIIVFLTGLFTGKVFVITEEAGYQKGSWSIVTYVSLGFYMVIITILLFKKKKVLSGLEFSSVAIMLILIALAALLQFLFPTELLTGSALALAFLLIYFTIQNPQLMLDPDTGLFNTRASSQLLTPGFAPRSGFHVAGFRVYDLHNIFMLYGRGVGNSVLRSIGDYLLKYNRAWSFRTGDATFAISFETEEALKNFVQKFEEDRKHLVPQDTVQLTPKVSLVCIKNAGRLGNGENIITVLENALDDKNVAESGGTVYLYADEIAGYQKNLIIENEVRKDLRDGSGFRMNYQPIWSRKENRFVAAEALVRYKSKELGTLYPDEFIPLIESKGLATELDEIVMRKVFEDINNGVFEGLSFDSVHINLSAASFTSDTLIKKVIGLADEYGIDHSFIIFEITETATVLSDDVLKKCAGLLREAGFGFALDDFGTGYATMARLASLPFTHAKLDREIVKDSSGIIGEITNIFRKFSMAVVAEGIETEDQLYAMDKAGIDLIQGYYYAKPMLPAEMRTYILSGRQADAI